MFFHLVSDKNMTFTAYLSDTEKNGITLDSEKTLKFLSVSAIIVSSSRLTNCCNYTDR